MTYQLSNVEKIQMLKERSINFNQTKNTIYVDGFDYTNMSDENFTNSINF